MKKIWIRTKSLKTYFLGILSADLMKIHILDFTDHYYSKQYHANFTNIELNLLPFFGEQKS